MGKAEITSHWFARWRERAPVEQDDPADMGTAFGLEMTLIPLAPEAHSSATAAAKPGWMQRLAEHRRSRS
jgi:hypothetical protein